MTAPPFLPISIAVVGAGKTSQELHMPTLAQLQKEGYLRLRCVCDLNRQAAEKAAKAYGFEKIAHDTRDVFSDEDVEAVYVFGPARLHFECARGALRAGKHVFVEKPPAENVEQLREIAALAHEHDRVFAAGFNRRYQPPLLEAKKNLDALGSLTMAEAVFHKPAMGQAVPYGARTWLGGNAIHAVDTLHFLFGEPASELHSCHNRISGDTPENFSAILRWESGGHATLASNNTAGQRLERYGMHGAGVSYYCEDDQLIAHVRKSKTTQSFAKKSLRGVDKARGFYGEHLAFAEAVRNGTRLSNDVQAAIAATHVVALIEEGFSGPIDWSALKGLEEAPPIPASAPLQSRNGSKRTAIRGVDGPAILVMNPGVVKNRLPQLAERYRVVHPDTLGDVDKPHVVAVITGKGGGAIDRDLLVQLPNLAVVGMVAAAVSKYDPEALLARDIPIINASDVYADAVAEFALLMAMVGVRNASRSHDAMRSGGWGIGGSGRWSTVRPMLKRLWKRVKRRGGSKGKSGSSGGGVQRGRGGTRNFAGVSVGLFGWGQTAKKFALLLRPFGCDVRVYSAHVTDDEVQRCSVRRASLAEVLDADVVSLHRAVTERTKGSFGKTEIDAMKPGTVFINTARAALVDNEVLLTRLRKGTLFACLDVFPEEPLPGRSPLRKLPNVFLASHISGSTDMMYQRSAEAVAEKVLAYLDGDDVESIITTPERLANMGGGVQAP